MDLLSGHRFGFFSGDFWRCLEGKLISTKIGKERKREKDFDTHSDKPKWMDHVRKIYLLRILTKCP